MNKDDAKALQLARDVMKAGNFEAAQNQLRILAKRCPADSSILRLYAQALTYTARLEEASEALEQLVNLHGNDPEIRMLAGDIFLRRKLYDLAAEQFRVAQKMAPLDPASQIAQAYAEAGRCEFEKASVLLKSAESTGASKAVLETARASFAEGQGDLAGALTHMEAAIAHDDSDPRTRYAMGRLKSISGNYEEAREWYKQVPPNCEVYAEALYGDGVAAYHLGDIEEAVRLWNAAIGANPNYIIPYDELGRLLLKSRRWIEFLRLVKKYHRYHGKKKRVYNSR